MLWLGTADAWGASGDCDRDGESCQSCAEDGQRVERGAGGVKWQMMNCRELGNRGGNLPEKNLQTIGAAFRWLTVGREFRRLRTCRECGGL